MWTLLPAILFALFVWWFTTGLALWVVGLSERSPKAVAAGAAILLAGSLAGLATTAGDVTPTGAYLAFTAAIGVWGAQEVAFLSGWITGPWRAPCPVGAQGWSRTGYAIRAIIYHELALAASGLAVAAASWGGANQVGGWTFAVLFAMRISAKLNVFLGVPNITEDFLPARVAYLKTFFARRPMNPLFPVSATVSTVAMTLLTVSAGDAEGGVATGLALLATLVALGLIEHWFMVLPLPVEALWAWSRTGRGASAASPDRTTNGPVAALHPAE